MTIRPAVLARAARALSALALAACTPGGDKVAPAASAPYVARSVALSPREAALCDSLGLDSALLAEFKGATTGSIAQLRVARTTILGPDGVIDSGSDAQPAMAGDLASDRSDAVVRGLRAAARAKGCMPFIHDRNFGTGGRPDRVAIARATSIAEVLKMAATDGINYDIDNDSVIAIVRGLEGRLSLSLVGAGPDWCEFEIGRQDVDWEALAKESYDIAPDIVDQGTGSVAELASELRKTRTLFFWWD